MVKETIYKVNTQEAVKSVGDLRDNIQKLKYGWKEVTDEGEKFHKGLQQMELGSKEYNATLTELQMNQNALKDAMHATTAEYDDIINAATGANVVFNEQNQLVMTEGVSYNALVHTLADLKQAWRSTTDEATRADLGKRINSVNDQLKEMDKSVGVFGRNVGNYIGAVDHLTSGLQSMGKGAAGLAGPLKSATAGFKALSATPAVAILGILANVLQKVIDALDSSEENAQELRQALAPFEAIGDAIIKTLQAAGQLLVKAVGWVGNLTKAILGNNDAAKERLRIAKEQNALDLSMRDRMIQDAKDERQVAELRAKASERLTYTAQERLDFLQEAGRLESEISRRGVEDAKRQYEIIKAKNAVSKSGKQDLDAEAKAYADMYRAETAYYQQLRQINQGITRARRELIKEEREEAKAVKEAAAAKLSARKEYLQQLLDVTMKGTRRALAIELQMAEVEYRKRVADARQKIRNQGELHATLLVLEKAYQNERLGIIEDYNDKVRSEEVKSLQNQADALQKGTVEYYAALEAVRAKEYDTLKRRMDETDAEWQARRIAALRALKEAQNATEAAVIAETRLTLENAMNALAEGSVEQLTKAVELAQYDLDNLFQGIDETAEQFAARRLAAEKALREALTALQEESDNQERQAYEQRLITLEEGSAAYLEAAVALKRYELDTLHQMEDESNEEFRTRQLEAERAYTDAMKDMVRGRVAVMQQYASGLSGIMGTIADTLETGEEVSEEQAQKAKALRIAGAVIDMLSGVVGAISQAYKSADPWTGGVLAALNSAAIIAAGTLNIKKMQATDATGRSSTTATAAAPAVVQAPVVEPQFTQTRSITGASEEDRLNRMASESRVYILSSDLEADADSRRVRVAETTF